MVAETPDVDGGLDSLAAFALWRQCVVAMSAEYAASTAFFAALFPRWSPKRLMQMPGFGFFAVYALRLQVRLVCDFGFSLKGKPQQEGPNP